MVAVPARIVSGSKRRNWPMAKGRERTAMQVVPSKGNLELNPGAKPVGNLFQYKT